MFSRAAGQAVAAVIKLVKAFAVLLFKEPSSAIELLSKLFGIFFDFVVRLFNQVIDTIGDDIFKIVKDTVVLVFNFIRRALGDIFVFIFNEVKARLLRINLTVIKAFFDFASQIKKIILDFLKSPRKVFKFILDQILEFNRSLVKAIKTIFVDLRDIVAKEIERLLLVAIQKVGNFFRNRKGLIEGLSKLPGLGGLVSGFKLVDNQLAKVDERIKQIDRDLAKTNSQTLKVIADFVLKSEKELKKLGDLFPVLKSLVSGDVDVRLAEINDDLEKNQQNLSKNLKATVKQSLEDLKKIKDAAKDAVSSISAEEEFEKLKKNFAKTAKELQKTFKDSPLSKEIQALLKVFSQANLDKIKADILALRDKSRAEDSPQAADGATGAAAGKAGSGSGDDEKSEFEKLTDQLQLSVLNSLSNAFGLALQRFAEKGKLTMKDISEFAKGVFQETFGQAVDFLKKQLTVGLTKALEGIGSGPAVAGIVTGIIAGVSLLLSRIKSEATVVNKAIQDQAVETAERVRGVIAGDVNIPIQQVADRILTANIPVVARLDNITGILQEMLEIMRTNQGINRSNGFGDLGFIGGF